MRTRLLLIAFFVAGLWLASPHPVRPVAFIIATAVGALLVLIGLAAARTVGRDAPILDGTGTNSVALRRLAISLALGALCGALLLAVLIYGLVPIEPPLATRLKARAAAPAWLPLALAVSASILEELVLRLFFLSSLVYLLSRAWRTLTRPISPVIPWSAILISALAFGFIHLPAWLAVTQPTAPLLASVLALNSVAGVLFGYLYWHWGIEAAILAHFAGDVVIQTLGPRLLG